MFSIVLLFLAGMANAIFGQKWQRVLVCFIAIVPTVVHFIWFDDLPAIQYYATAAVASSITIGLLEFVPRSPLSFHIQVINWLFILVNFIGFVMWYSYTEPLLYNMLTLALVIIEFLRLMIRTREDGRYRASDFVRTVRDDAAINGQGHL